MCSCLRRNQTHINSFFVHPLPQQSIDSCHVHWVAHRNICSWLRRDSCVQVKSLSVPLCASLPATKHIKLPRPLQFEVFCFHIASHGALGRHFSGMKIAGWSHGTPNEDFGCITSHAQSTVATYFTGAVSSDVVHLIVLCWALVFRRSSPV